MECPNCKTTNPDGADFCLTCGWDFPAAPAQVPSVSTSEKCPHCGASNPPEAAFCSLCNENLTPTAAPEASAPAPIPEGVAPPPGGGDPLPAPLPQAGDLMHQAMDTALKPAEALQLAKKELADNNREMAAKMLLETMRNYPSNRELRALYRESFSDRELRHMNLQVAPVPIWSELDRTLLYPLRDNEWLGILIGGPVLGAAMFLAGYAFPWGFAVVIFVLSYCANVLARHLKWASVGRPGHPGIIEFHFGDLAYVVWSGVASMWPALVLVIFLGVRVMQHGWRISPIGVTLVLTLAGLSYLVGCVLQPMSMLVGMLFNTWSMCFDYSFILRTIRVVWKDYLFATLLLLVMGVVQLVYKVAAAAVMPKAIAFIGQGAMMCFLWMLELYNLALLGHVLGRIYYCNEKRLAWFDDNAVQPKTSPLAFAALALGVVLMFGVAYVSLQPTDAGSSGWGNALAGGKNTGPCREAWMTLYSRGANPKRAVELADKALEENEDYAGAHMARAVGYMQLGKLRDALKSANQAIKLAPKYPLAYQIRASIYMRGGKRNRTVRDQKKANALAQNAEEMDLRQAWEVFDDRESSTEP